MQQTILMTGATGYLGSRLLPGLMQSGYTVIALKRAQSDVSRIRSLLKDVQTVDIDAGDDQIEAIFARQQVDIILHAATTYGYSDKSFATVTQSNLLLPLRLLDLGMQHGTTTFINIDTIIDNPQSAYSLSKKQFRQWLQLAAKHITGINLALATFYGPEDNDKKFFGYILREILHKADHIDLTEGRQKRDFIFIDDVIEAFSLIMSHLQTLTSGFHHFDIGTQQLVEIRELVELVKQHAGNTSTELRFGALPYRSNEVMEPVVDLAPLAALGWRPKTSLDKGIVKTIHAERRRQST